MIYHQYINNKTAVKIFVESNENENKEENKIFNIQIKHKFKIEEEIYKKLIIKFLFNTKIKQTTLKHISKK